VKDDLLMVVSHQYGEPGKGHQRRLVSHDWVDVEKYLYEKGRNTALKGRLFEQLADALRLMFDQDFDRTVPGA
jgi:hypothetical protein